jgi:peptidoglycan hydrolase-like protein with peptidoglycan-binding domain
MLSVVSLASAAQALENGDSGSEVTELQTRLSNQGYYDGPITGYYGPLTQEAVIRFQQERGLTADGIAGERTLSALEGSNQATTTSGVLKLGATGNAVSTLQNSLQAAGFYDGPTTGYFGSSTENAVIRFQRANGLTADGIAGSNTQEALRSYSSTTATTFYPAQSYNNPSPPSVSSSSSSLRRGDSGDAVTNLQTRLKAAGYFDGPITGYFGSLTETAVIRFQQAKGLPADGVVGSTTLAALPGARSNPSRTVANQFSVLELQRRLKARGFYAGSLDGDMGPLTQRAIAAAQRFYGVSDRDVRNGRF